MAARTTSTSNRSDGSSACAVMLDRVRRPATIAMLTMSTVTAAARNAGLMPNTCPSIRKAIAPTHIWNVPDAAASERKRDGTASASSA
jgi:hypothetical protein